jgi:pyruvate kinase
MNKATKIVATIGPATESEEVIAKLIDAGMNVARFNTKHSDPAWHTERIARVKKVAAEKGVPIGVLVDLQGPEVRINLPQEKPFDVSEGELVTFTSDENTSAERSAVVPQLVVKSLQTDDLILLDDGACEFIVTSITNTEITAKAVTTCTVKHRKTMNTPGVVLDMPSITERDRQYLEGIEPSHIDFVGLSFVRTAEDIADLKKELVKNKINADIVAKIENQAALDNLDEIIAVSDAIMIARGDLGVEVDYQKLVYWQKQIIEKSRDAAKPVITATQMLKSMVESPRPTRAEVSDVAHAIYDGTDAVMLSEETTIGKYPVKAVATQAEIAKFNEPYVDLGITLPKNISSSLNITTAAAYLLKHTEQHIDKIITLTETGHTAKLISRFRPKAPLLVATHVKETYTRLSLVYGVQPFLLDFPEGVLLTTEQLVDKFKKAGMVKAGETVLLIHGSVWKKAGLTNTLAILEVE